MDNFVHKKNTTPKHNDHNFRSPTTITNATTYAAVDIPDAGTMTMIIQIGIIVLNFKINTINPRKHTFIYTQHRQTGSNSMAHTLRSPLTGATTGRS